MRINVNGVEYSKPEDVPEYEGTSIILFHYPGDDKYYDKPYVKECMRSWQTYFKDPRFISILIDDEVKALSAWTQKCNGNRKYMTDSLRVYFVNQFDRCLYLDTDVFLCVDAVIDFNKYDCFCLSCCTGTFLYNKAKHNKILDDFWNFYNNDLVKEEHFWENSDIIAWQKFDRLPTIPKPEKVAHFSCFWDWINKQKDIVICNEEWVRKTTKDKPNDIVHFPAQSFMAVMKYIIDKGYNVRLSFGVNIGEKIINFR